MKQPAQISHRARDNAELKQFAVEAAETIRGLQSRCDANSRALDAMMVLLGRYVAPDLSPGEIVAQLVAVRREMDAAEAMGAG